LVVQACERHKSIVTFIHFPKYGREDRKGKDVSVTFRHNDIGFNMQVTTSDNGETVGLYLPVSDPPPSKIAPRLTSKMLSKLYYHQHHYFQGSDDPVRYILFVAKLTGEKELDAVIQEIWAELLVFYNHAFSIRFNAIHSCRQKSRSRVPVS